MADDDCKETDFPVQARTVGQYDGFNRSAELKWRSFVNNQYHTAYKQAVDNRGTILAKQKAHNDIIEEIYLAIATAVFCTPLMTVVGSLAASAILSKGLKQLAEKNAAKAVEATVRGRAIAFTKLNGRSITQANMAAWLDRPDVAFAASIVQDFGKNRAKDFWTSVTQNKPPDVYDAGDMTTRAHGILDGLFANASMARNYLYLNWDRIDPASRMAMLDDLWRAPLMFPPVGGNIRWAARGPVVTTEELGDAFELSIFMGEVVAKATVVETPTHYISMTADPNYADREDADFLNNITETPIGIWLSQQQTNLAMDRGTRNTTVNVPPDAHYGVSGFGIMQASRQVRVEDFGDILRDHIITLHTKVMKGKGVANLTKADFDGKFGSGHRLYDKAKATLEALADMTSPWSAVRGNHITGNCQIEAKVCV